MRWLIGWLAVLVGASAALAALPVETSLFNPYDRPKNGPPLTNVFSKVEPDWLWSKLRQPDHDPSARMPDLQLSEEEVLDIMAYLKSLNEPSPGIIRWPAWAAKSFDELDDDEFMTALDLADRGRAVWGRARCTICHAVNGPADQIIGGFVDLRVGGIDLQIASPKLKRDWLYRWTKDPKDYFPDTLMPRYRFSDEDARALVEYILRDDAFIPAEEEVGPDRPDDWQMLDDPQRIARGERLVDLSRCVVCHDIEGVEELLSLPVRSLPPPAGSFKFLVYDLRCLSCHPLGGSGGTYAPDLTDVGSRLDEAWMAQFLETPDIIRPLSQQMPRFNLTASEASTLASYLSASLRDDRIPLDIPGGPTTDEEMRAGRVTFRDKGCLACHDTSEEPGGVVGPSLVGVGNRLLPGYTWFHLKYPHAVDPLSAEPDYGLSDEEARVLAAHLNSSRQ